MTHIRYVQDLDLGSEKPSRRSATHHAPEAVSDRSDDTGVFAAPADPAMQQPIPESRPAQRGKAAKERANAKPAAIKGAAAAAAAGNASDGDSAPAATPVAKAPKPEKRKYAKASSAAIANKQSAGDEAPRQRPTNNQLL